MSDYSATFPSQRPAFTADFSNGSKIDPRATFSRASTGTFFGTDKVLSSENILLQSQTLDTTWAAADIAAPTGSQTAPDGSSTAWLLTADSASSQTPYVRQSPTFSGSTQYTMVGHLKAGTASHGYISFRTQNGYSAYALLDFSGGTVSHAGFGDFTGVSSSVTALGSSWFKVTLTATTGTNLSGSNVFVGISDGTTPVGTGYATWNSAGETMYAWGIQLSSTNTKVYDSPTTTQLARSYQTKLQTAASGAARFEHSAIDGQSEGILIEGQATNLNPYSDALASWPTSGDVTLTSNASLGPDGTLGADLVVANTNNTGHYVRSSGITVSASTSYTLSGYFKSVNGEKVRLSFFRGSSPYTGEASVKFTLSGSGSVSASIGSGTITSVGNGWYRCTATGTTLTTNSLIQVSTVSTGDAQDYAGNSYNGVLCAGIQFESGSFASSLISTSGASATRAAESLSVALSDINQNPIGNAVSAVAEFDTNANDAQFRRVMVLKSGTTGLRIDPQVYSGTGYVYVANTSGGTTELTNKSGVGTGFHKVAIGLDGTTANASFDGATAATMSNADTASVQFDTLQIGSYSATQLHLEGHIRNVSLYNVGLSATNVEALTS